MKEIESSITSLGNAQLVLNQLVVQGIPNCQIVAAVGSTIDEVIAKLRAVESKEAANGKNNS